tara:strand:- start:287661 stop:288377 length:717 start_codon:yes stop_codon:yes gene_type:complete
MKKRYLIVLGLFLLIGVQGVSKKIRITHAPDAPATFRVMDVTFKIPHGFLNKLIHTSMMAPLTTPRIKNTYGVGVYLKVVYPDMHMFDQKTYFYPGTRTMRKEPTSVVIYARPGSAKTRQQGLMEKQYADGECNAKAPGDICPHYFELMQDDRESIYLGPTFDFVFCSKIGSVRVPHCDLHYMFANEIEVNIHFDRALLDDVKNIRRNVNRRICSWIPARRSASNTTVAMDALPHCTE